MNKNEFLRILRESLELSLEQNAITAQIDYYDKYISDEINKGRTEHEVIEELGDPRLIAKTIKTVSNTKDINNDSDNIGDGSQKYGSDRSSNRGYGNTQSGNRKYSTYVDTSGIGCVLAGIVTFIIVSLIFRALSSMVYGLGNLAFSGPIGFLTVLGLFYFLFGRGGRR